MSEERIYRWKLIRNSKHDQRIWKDTESEQYYLADHSGDGRSTTGRPDETDDGPLRIITPDRFVGKSRGNGISFPIETIQEKYSLKTQCHAGFNVVQALAQLLVADGAEPIPIYLKQGNLMFRLEDESDKLHDELLRQKREHALVDLIDYVYRIDVDEGWQQKMEQHLNCHKHEFRDFPGNTGLGDYY